MAASLSTTTMLLQATMLSPRILERSGVPVHQVVQEAGELVVTFPSVYHANLDLGTGLSTVFLPDASIQQLSYPTGAHSCNRMASTDATVVTSFCTQVSMPQRAWPLRRRTGCGFWRRARAATGASASPAPSTTSGCCCRQAVNLYLRGAQLRAWQLD